MYSTLLIAHSIVRWLVLASILLTIYRSIPGYFNNKTFTGTDNTFRHWTATIAHIQLMIGIILYTQSPIVKYYWKGADVGTQNTDSFFFGIIHILLMLVAVVILTIGSALAKRKIADKEKFKTILVWYSVVLIIILAAITWPFSPITGRPYFRIF